MAPAWHVGRLSLPISKLSQQTPQGPLCRSMLHPQPSEASPNCVTVQDKAGQGSKVDIGGPRPVLAKSWLTGASFIAT